MSTRSTPLIGLALAGLLLGLTAAGCARPAARPAVACEGLAWRETRLSFGLSIPGGGEVGDAAWQAFVDAEIVPAFEDGFTLLDGTGFWRDRGTGRTGQEKTKVLVVVHPVDPSVVAALERIAGAYIERFEQQAVLRAEQPVCVDFLGAGS